MIGGGGLTTILAIFVQQCVSTQDRWDKVEQEIQRLIRVILIADASNNPAVPPYSSSKLQKLVFLREFQMKVHTKNWSSLSQQIPLVDENSSLRGWEDAVAGHRMIEQKNHPGSFASFEAKARWQEISDANAKSLVITLPVAALGVSESQSCSNCKSAPRAFEFFASKVPPSIRTINGIKISKKTAASLDGKYPVIKLSDPEISKMLRGNIEYKNEVDGYFVPSAESLIQVQNAGALELRE